MVYKCKICGGSLSVDSKTRIATCEYCGTQQVLPQFSDDSGRILYERGNHYLSVSEYDKAESIFNQLLAINPNDPEFYWDLVLCKYGVTFVCDPQSGKYIPTCNRTHFSSILHDENFLKALQLSTPDKAELYQQNADTIDEIQKGILVLSRKEKPFDIFISYKETDANGNRSRDSVKAQDLYEKLTSEGYKVFFSRITLEDKIGTQYEPYIYAALSSSKVMLTVCSSKENIESAWVKNEWSRFLTLRQSDTSKTLIPLYYDMQKSDLPEEFAILSAQDMQKEDFEQELIRGIKKLIPLPIMLAAKRKKQRKTIGIVAAVLCGVLLIGGAISFPFLKTSLENRKTYQAAMQLYYDGNYPEAAWAFRDMDGFSDSTEMQKKCELAWRESLATVATYVSTSEGQYSGGSYYITANGTVECFDFNMGNANSGIDIGEHGKVVSIAENYTSLNNYGMYVLYEDGYVYSNIQNESIEAGAYSDIIQITPSFNATNVALKNDGTLAFGETTNLQDSYYTDDWLSEVSGWKDVIKLEWTFLKSPLGTLSYAVLAGIDKDGYVHSAFYVDDKWTESKKILSGISKIQDYMSSLENINSVSISGYENSFFVAALDSQNATHLYADGDTSVVESIDALSGNIEIFGNAKTFLLSKQRNLYLLDDGKTIMEDVVYFDKSFLVTRSGSIYEFYGSTPSATDAKTAVKDVWLERR